MLRLTTTCLILLTTAAPAAASTIPVLPDRQGQLSVSAGLADFNADFALTESLSAGVSYIPYMGLMPFVSAGRLTWRLGETPAGLRYGLTVSAGGIANVFGNVSSAQGYSFWLQPALNVEMPLGPVMARGTVGPVFFNGYTALPFATWPNLELAVPLGGGHELVLGGNAAIGWRGTF